MRFIASLIVAFASVAALPAAAQELPGRVGRIAHIEGSAAVYQEPEEGWERAYVNGPITSENSVWTDPGSRAELRVGGIAVRLEEATQVDIARLDDDELDAFIPRGTAAVRVRHYDRNERVVFNTPHARFSIRANGRYRVDVDPDREESRLTVFAGEARVGSDSGRIRASAGQTVRIFGGAQPSYVVERAFADPFDRWAEARDANWVETRSVQYVSPYMTGYEDLDRYGEWREESDFGALWFPTRVARDWAPYRYGRWDYVRPWGWTWVDDAPWGYAPFHYGRWVYVRDRWAWSPGAREVRPAWAPALVAWIGGSNFNIGVSSGGPSVGWYPLSPWDRYQPWYNASPTYVNRINIIVRDRPQRDDRRQWQEWTRDRGVTVVNREAVVDRRPVQQAMVQVRPEAIRQAQAATTTAAAVLPTRTEVIQRRQSERSQAASGAAPAGQQPRAGAAAAGAAAGAAAAIAVQRGERAGPVARPDFARKPPAVAATPEPAKAPPPPAQRVTPPTAAAQQQAREQKEQTRAQQEQARDTRAAEQQKTREGELQQREAQQQMQQERAAREAQQKQALEQKEQTRAQQERANQEKNARAVEQNQQREQMQERIRQERAAREAQQNQQKEQQQGQERAQQERAAREAQQAQQREAQKQAQERAQQERAAREAQQNQQRQQAQQAQERAQQEKQQREAQQAQQRQQQQQAQERAAQEKQQRAQQQQQQQQQQQRAQPQPQPQQQEQQPQQSPQAAQREAKERARQEREKAKAEREEEEKKGKGR